MTRGQVSGPLTLQLGRLHFERRVLVLHGLALLQHEHLQRPGFRLRPVIGTAGGGRLRRARKLDRFQNPVGKQRPLCVTAADGLRAADKGI